MCPLCSEIGKNVPLEEAHIVFKCPMLRQEQNLHGLTAYRARNKTQRIRKVLWLYLGGDKCSDQELLTRAKGSDELLCEYWDRLKMM